MEVHQLRQDNAALAAALHSSRDSNPNNPSQQQQQQRLAAAEYLGQSEALRCQLTAVVQEKQTLMEAHAASVQQAAALTTQLQAAERAIEVGRPAHSRAALRYAGPCSGKRVRKYTSSLKQSERSS